MDVRDRDGVWISGGLSAEFKVLYRHPVTKDVFRVQTVAGECYVYGNELVWGGEEREMDEKAPDTRVETFIHVPLAKGTYLLLTFSEYKRGISRGKCERRRLANEARLGKIIAERATISFPYQPSSP